MIEINQFERKLLRLICRDKTNLEISEILGENLRQIERYKAKLHVTAKTKSNLGLFKWAVKNGFYKFKY